LSEDERTVHNSQLQMHLALGEPACVVELPANGGVVSFAYDPFGRRIQKTRASGSTILHTSLCTSPCLDPGAAQAGHSIVVLHFRPPQMVF